MKVSKESSQTRPNRPAINEESLNEQWNKSEVKRTFRLDVSATLMYSVYSVAIGSFPAILVRKEGAATWIVSLIIAAPSIGSFSAIFWSRITEKMPRMKVMLIGGGLARLSLMLTLFAFNPLLFALVMVICNVLEISKSPAYAAIMQQVYPNHRRGELMGKVRVATSIATIVAAAVVGRLFEVIDFRYVYVMAGLFGLGSILTFTRVHYYGKPLQRPPTPLKKMLLIPRTDKRYGAFLASTFVVGFANWMAISIYPLIAVDELHVTSSFYGILGSVTSALSIIFYFVWGAYSDRRHPIVLTFISFALPVLNFVVYLIAWDPLFLFIVAVVNGIANTAGDLSSINNAIRFPKDPHDVPHYMALYTSLIGIRGIVAPFLVSGLLVFLPSRWVLTIGLLLMLLGLLNFYVVMRRLLRDPEFADPLNTPSVQGRRLFPFWRRSA